MNIPVGEYVKLVELCNIQSHSRNEKRIVLYIIQQLQTINLSYEIDEIGNILVTKGNAKSYPCIVAHMDTVHKIKKGYEIYRTIGKETGTVRLRARSGKQSVGIGGDDKCGIFACLYFLKILPAVKVVFFTQEETGCIGALGIDHSFFEDSRYIIELDRRGESDFIDVDFQGKMISHNFSSEIGHLKKKYNFKSAKGLWTDVVRLWEEGVGVSCVNVSAGYYNPHTSKEYIIPDVLWNSIKFIEELIRHLKAKPYPSSPPEYEIVVSHRGHYNKYSSVKKRLQCRVCHQWKEKAFIAEHGICYLCKYAKNNPNVTSDSDDRPCKKHSTALGIETFLCSECKYFIENSVNPCSLYPWYKPELIS